MTLLNLAGDTAQSQRNRCSIRPVLVHWRSGIFKTIAVGMVEYRKGVHTSVLSVFEEADKAMYERKQLMKESILSDDYQPESEQEFEDIPVINVRKHILIADDVEMSRNMLGDLLEDEYDICYAADGVEALEMLRSHKDEIDLVLLDLQMPNMNGREVIAEMQVDEDLMSIPVVFLTVDQKAELDCLKIGAMDFIPKPYPDIEIVKARIAKCIELSEDRDLIRHTERDKLTGLLNRDYFFRYVSRLDQIYKDTTLDAVVCDVNQYICPIFVAVSHRRGHFIAQVAQFEDVSPPSQSQRRVPYDREL